MIREEKQLCRQARQIAKGSETLFHGTRYPLAILRSGLLLHSLTGDRVVSFSRSPEVAAYWAMMRGREHGDPAGAIFVLNRRTLAQRYAIKQYHDPIWDTAHARNDEQEERVWHRDIDIRRHLLGIAWQDYPLFKEGEIGMPADWVARMNLALARWERLYRELPVGPQRT